MGETETIQVPKELLTSEDKTALFEMYKQTYTSAGQELWFKSVNELFDYPRYKCIVTLGNPSNMRKAFIMFQFKRNYNKISLVCQDGTPDGKAMVMDILKLLLSSPGYCLEASGAVSWVLQKAKVPIINVKEKIEEALDITLGNKNDYIEMNPNFSPATDKSIQAYTRYYTDPLTQKEYVTTDTLFGTEGCVYQEGENCSRTCRTKGSGTRRRRRTVRRGKRVRSGRQGRLSKTQRVRPVHRAI
jgi:hypothetical protein